MSNLSKNKTINGLFWRTFEGIGVQGVQFLIQLVLARILDPEDFGIVAILSIFVHFANTFVQNGLSSALLQRKVVTQIDFHTVFVIEFSASILMYAFLFLLAPAIAAFYGNPSLIEYLRVFSLITIICGFSSSQATMLRYRMDFKSSFVANLIGIILQGCVGITMALHAYGAWSLIWAQIAYNFTSAILLCKFARYKPKFQFSIASFKQSFSYSWKLFLGWMIGNLYNDTFSLIIGKQYNEKTLGYYSKGSNIPNVINRTISQITTSVMFPSISKIQTDRDKVKQQTRMMISVSAALVFPVMAGLAGTAESLVKVILTEKWLPSVPIIQIICIPAAINIISNANMQTFNALGRSDLFLKCEIIKRSITIVLVLIFSKIDFYLMLVSIPVMGVISLCINGYHNMHILDYSITEQLTDIVPYILFAMMLFIPVYLLNLLQISTIVCLAIQIIFCVVIYFGGIFLVQMQAFIDIRYMIFSLLNKQYKQIHNS